MRVKLLGQKNPLIAEVVDLEIRAAIDLAFNRVGRAVARQLGGRTSGRSIWRIPFELVGVESQESMA